MPFFGLAAVAIGTANLAARFELDVLVAALRAIGVAASVIAFLAFLKPDHFLPTWFRQAEERQDAGLPPLVPPPPEGTEVRRMSTRMFLAVNATLGAFLVAGVALDWPRPALGGLATGIAYVSASQLWRTRSGANRGREGH